VDRYDWETRIDGLFEYPRYGSFLPDAGFSPVEIPEMGVPQGIRFDPVYGAGEPYTFEQGDAGVDPSRILASAPPVAYHPSVSVERGMGELRRPQALPTASIGEASSLIRSMVKLASPQPTPDFDNFLPSFGPGASSEKTRWMPQIGSGRLSDMINKLLRWGMDGETGEPDPTQYQGGGQAGPSPYAALDAHNAELNAAAAHSGVPANLLKSVMNRESSGNWEANNYTNPSRGSYMLPFMGIFKAAAESVGFDFEAMKGNKQMQINAAAAILKRDYEAYGSWEAALSNYLTGDPNAWKTGGSDPEGTLTAEYYVGQAIALWKELDAASGGTGQATGGSAGGVFSSSLWGDVPASISYEFNAESVNGDMYNYGSAHGTNGWVHPGIDVSVPHGTVLYTPKDGIVSCVGTADAGIGGTGGGSCGHFGDTDTGGVGNVTIKFDDGTFLVFGHSQAGLVPVGTRVRAGQAVARSGGMGGAHVHFEYRVPGGCDSGYCVADPRQVVPLNSSGGGTSAPAGSNQRRTASQRWWY
jgi:murein DD-endopeptidase MepM/ murein hydrolase activator NlpD